MVDFLEAKRLEFRNLGMAPRTVVKQKEDGFTGKGNLKEAQKVQRISFYWNLLDVNQMANVQKTNSEIFNMLHPGLGSIHQ